MARVLLSAVQPTLDGATVTYGAATVDGDAVAPGSVLLVNNGDASPITLTLPTPGKVAGLDIDDKTVTVPATTEVAVAIPGNTIYKQTSGTTEGLVHVDYSAVTSVTRVCFAGS